MLTVSNQFKNAFRDPRRMVEFKAVVNGVEYGPDKIVEITIKDILQEDTFALGTTAASEMTISLRTPDELPVKAEIRLYLRAARLIWDMATMTWANANTPWNDASSESIPFGVFYVDERRRIGSLWEYTCLDALILAEQPFLSQLTYPASMSAVLAEACGLAGIESEVTVPPSLTFRVAPTGYSCRAVIGLVAQAMASCSRINKMGRLSFVSFAGSPVETVFTSDYRKVVHTNPVKSISRVVCVIDDEGAALEAGEGGEDNTVTINNPYLDQAGVNGVQAALNGFTYHPISMDWICLPWVEVGDRITVQEYIGKAWNQTSTAWNETSIPWNGIGTWNTTVMSNTIKYRGGLNGTIAASSDSQQQSEFKPVGSIAQQINRLNQNAVKLGKPYYGLTVTKEHGLKIERSDGKSDITLNSDVMDWRVDGESRMYYDAQSGKLKYKGDIIMQGGSISWEHTNAPTPSDVGALPVDSPKLANLSNLGEYIGALSQGQVTGLSSRLTKITETGVYTGTVGTDQLIAGNALIGSALIDKIRANQIDVATGKITAAQIDVTGLYVGPGGIQLSPQASISWDHITGQPSNIYNPSYLQSTYITATSLFSPAIYGGTIAIGSGNSIFKADEHGIYLGNAAFGSAPFRVDTAGNVYAQNGNFSGTLKTAPYGTRVEMSSNFADINLYNGSLNILAIRDQANGNVTIYNPSGNSLGIGNGVTGQVNAHGPWNFSNASVTGLSVPARFS